MTTKHNQWAPVFRCLDAEVPVPAHVVGPPGVGKTQVIGQYARSKNWGYLPVLASLRGDASGVVGLQIYDPKSGDTRFSSPEWYRRVVSLSKKHDRVIVFFDELVNVPPSISKALMDVIQERRVGDREIPGNVAFIAASNPVELAAEGFELPPPLANRFLHFEVTASLEGWLAWMLHGETAGQSVYAGCGHGARVVDEGVITAFVQLRPQWLLALPRTEAERGGAWPSPRSWDMLRHAARGVRCLDCIGALAAAALGPGAAAELLGWLRQLELPDPEAVLARPADYPLPTKKEVLLPLATSLAAAISARGSASRYAAFVQVIDRLRAEHADVAVLAVRSVKQEVRASREFLDQADALIRLWQDLGMF